jgi:hypothetical protein
VEKSSFSDERLGTVLDIDARVELAMTLAGTRAGLHGIQQ